MLLPPWRFKPSADVFELEEFGDPDLAKRFGQLVERARAKG